MLLLMPVLQRTFSVRLVLHDSLKNAPLSADAAPSPDQHHFPEKRLAKLQPIEAGHVAAGIAADKMKGLGHELSLAEPRPDIQFPF